MWLLSPCHGQQCPDIFPWISFVSFPTLYNHIGKGWVLCLKFLSLKCFEAGITGVCHNPWLRQLVGVSIWVPKVEFRRSDLVASNFTCWAISLVHTYTLDACYYPLLSSLFPANCPFFFMFFLKLLLISLNMVLCYPADDVISYFMAE